MDVPIDIPVTSDKPTRRAPPARFAAMMKAKESAETEVPREAPKAATATNGTNGMRLDGVCKKQISGLFVMSVVLR